MIILPRKKMMILDSDLKSTRQICNARLAKYFMDWIIHTTYFLSSDLCLMADIFKLSSTWPSIKDPAGDDIRQLNCPFV